MPHQEAGVAPRTRETEPVNNVVEPSLQYHQEILAGDPAGLFRCLETAPELLLEQPVHALDLLLLPELEAVFRELEPSLAVLTRRVVAPFNGALVRVTPLSLEKQLQILSPAEPTHGTMVPSH